MNKYLRIWTTEDQLRSGRPLKLSDKKLNDIVKCVNNRSGISQRKIGRCFHVHHSTISCHFQKRTSIRIRKRRTAPKMESEDQEKRAKTNRGKLYRKLLPGCDLILDDEKFFTFTGDNAIDNRVFYSTDPTTARIDVKFRKKKKFEPKIMVWMVMSSNDVSDVYVHKSKQAIRQDTYLNQCLNKRLLPFIDKYHQNGNYLF